MEPRLYDVPSGIKADGKVRLAIGTKHVAPLSLLEQRTRDAYHQRYPWPDGDDARLQRALLGAKSSRRSEWAVALVSAAAVVAGLAIVALH